MKLLLDGLSDECWHVLAWLSHFQLVVLSGDLVDIINEFLILDVGPNRIFLLYKAHIIFWVRDTQTCNNLLKFLVWAFLDSRTTCPGEFRHKVGILLLLFGLNILHKLVMQLAELLTARKMQISVDFSRHNLAHCTTIHRLVNSLEYLLRSGSWPWATKTTDSRNKIVHGESTILTENIEVIKALFTTDKASFDNFVNLGVIYVGSETLWCSLVTLSRSSCVIRGVVRHQGVHCWVPRRWLNRSTSCILYSLKSVWFLHVCIASPSNQIILKQLYVNLVLIHAVNFTKGSNICQVEILRVLGVLTKELNEHVQS